jgi:hypothetical protein
MVIEDFGVVLGIVASLITIGGALVGLTNVPSDPDQRKVAFRVTLAAGAVLLAIAIVATGFAAWNYYNPSPAVVITHPSYGGEVGAAATISGTWTNTNNNTVWIVVYDYNASRYYPEAPEVSLNGGGTLLAPPTGTWVYHAYFNSTEVGKNFEVRAITADASATAALENYARVSSAKGSWNGMQSLPNGATTMDYIIVKRAG